MTNGLLLEKADQVLQDLKTDGGYMQPQQAQQFVQMMQETPTIISDARVETFPGDSMIVDKIGFSSRILRKGVEGTALSASDRAKPTTGKIQLVTKEVIAEVRLSYDTIEANIQREGYKDLIMKMIAERAAVDLEELIIQGDTTNGTDAYLALLDGLVKRASGGHVVDWLGATIDNKMWADTILAVPEKYLRIPADWRFYTDRVTEMRYKELIAERNTNLGDRYLVEAVNTTAQGIPVKNCAMMPHNLSYDADGEGGNAAVTNLGQAVLTHPKNLILGVSRKMQVETDKDISARQYIIVLTMKTDFQIEEKDAVGYLKNIKPSLT